MSGFRADMSSEAQSRRAKKNRGKTPWRAGPICPTRKAHDKFERDHKNLDLRGRK